jgi:phosphoenolpyruvate carboxykinase (GTP)
LIPFKDLSLWIEEMKTLCQPEAVHWCDGSESEYQTLLNQLVSEGKGIRLNAACRPDSYAFFSDPSDVARTENRTFIASVKPEDAGPTNNWISPIELKKTLMEKFRGSMKGRTMYVMPFMMGPFGSPLSKIGIQLTDSAYVVVHMHLMTRMGKHVLDEIEKQGSFIPCLHSVGYPLKENQKDLAWPCAPIEEKYIAHFPEERAIWSYGSGYGGNALLGKKCLALRIASALARDEGWQAEHMLILKITNPEGQYKYMMGAFPSACGKTNLAMMVPTLPGWKVETVGDDIAWIWQKEDGRLYAINPEYGFFGVVKNTSYESNRNAMMSIRKNTLFTNVALTDDGDVYWEGNGQDVPNHLIDWKRQDWTPDMKTAPSHPNARFTVRTSQSPVLAPEWEDPNGVPISAILLGGRRATTVPLVHESLSWNHGVFMGSIMGSEITSATISDKIGQVRRDPFAMLPFIGYHVGDYLRHWIEVGSKSEHPHLPKIYYVNWFLKDDQDDFLWPGFGNNARVLKWIFARCDHAVGADLTPIGYVPHPQDIDVKGLKMKPGALEKLTTVDIDGWLQEASSIRSFYDSIGEKLPEELLHELTKLEKRLHSRKKQSSQSEF